MRCRIEARRQHQIIALGEKHRIGAVLIFHRKPLAAVGLGAGLGDELVRTRDGQLVLGRVVSAEEAARWKPADYARAARETFQLLAPLYRLK